MRNQQLIIAHRGNVSGPDPINENTTKHIEKALKLDFDVEVDVWWREGKLWLGHDKPSVPIRISRLLNLRYWCHAKNIDALSAMLDYGGIHCFFHQADDATLTSSGYIWTYFGEKLTSHSICVMNNRILPAKPLACAGICTDHALEVRRLLAE